MRLTGESFFETMWKGKSVAESFLRLQVLRRSNGLRIEVSALGHCELHALKGVPLRSRPKS